MKVSIITVVYNGAATLRDCMQSVLNQTYPNLEYIVVDGNSSDGTQDIVRSYGDAVSCFVSEADKGIYDAMNKGIALATGDVIGILNADDFYSHDRVIENVVKTFQATGCDAAYGDLVYVSQEDTQRVTRYWKAGVYRPGAFRWGWMPPHPTFFVKRELYEKFGRFTLQFRSAADYELMLRMIHRHGVRVGYVNDVLVKMRTGGVSNRTVNNRVAANREDREAWRLNGLKPYFFTIWLKPLRKIFQFLPGNRPDLSNSGKTVS
ncbi:glycosyltransferase family 2 protein [Tellurirhabdus rosea]|uniref:glycosyltransferase family 2 protein n=1 Tax=Tellurirhabdus rosea TaxID=2674997 RepID=UPI002259C0F6|nr:glycosyltransferase family 2 protein [Tellurirhabdus rosea]